MYSTVHKHKLFSFYQKINIHDDRMKCSEIDIECFRFSYNPDREKLFLCKKVQKIRNAKKSNQH